MCQSLVLFICDDKSSVVKHHEFQFTLSINNDGDLRTTCAELIGFLVSPKL